MRRLAIFLYALCALCALPALCYAQAPVELYLPNTTPGKLPIVVNAANPLPVNASVSASVTGFAPGGAYATLTATGSSADVALPAGAVVAAFNTGTTAVSCQLTVGAGVAVASQNVIQPSSWFAFTVGSNTHASCIDQTGSTSNIVVFSGGTGLPTGAGGGGGGSGGVVSQPTAALLNMTEANSAAILAGVTGAIPAGTNSIGNVGTNPYPTGATPETASATGTTAATTATLATAGGVTTYICGFSIRANATAAATGNATVTGTITGTLNFTQWTAPAASGLGVAEMIFNPCVPANATNTTISVVSAAPGSGGVVSVTAWGFTK